MARNLELQTNVDGASADYPSGKIRNDSGAGDGTPVSESLYGDVQQFFAKLLRDSGISPNNLPDNTTNGFQLNKALIGAVLDSDWTPLLLQVNWIEQKPVAYRINGGKVEFKGKITYTNLPIGDIVIDLPAPIRTIASIPFEFLSINNTTKVISKHVGRVDSVLRIHSAQSDVPIDNSVLLDGLYYFLN